MSVGQPRTIARYLVVALAAVVSLVGLIPRPATGVTTEPVDYVVVAGAAGLRWDDVNATDTPTLWALAQRGAVGALSVRSAHRPTCPGDGWSTLGAGNFSRYTTPPLDDSGRCPSLDVTLATPDSYGEKLMNQDAVLAANATLPWGARAGALAESLRCTVAVGPGAVVAAARPSGRGVEQYHLELPADPAALLASCVLSIVDLGTVDGDDPAKRRAAAQAADRMLAKVVAARPPGSLLMVAGVSDTDATSRLHVAVAEGPGYHGGWLSSPSTSRPGYLQLVDLAPTVLAALHKPAPAKLFAGGPALRTGGRPAELTAAVRTVADADREARAQRDIAPVFLGLVSLFVLVVLSLVVLLLWHLRGPTAPVIPPAIPHWWLPTLERLLVAAALVLPVSLIADLVPWWRAGAPGLALAAVVLPALAGLTYAVAASRWWGQVLFAPGGLAALATAMIGLDLLTGSRLQLNGVAGYSALTGGRYAGIGAAGMGIFMAGILLTAGCMAAQVRRAWRPVMVAVIGGFGVVAVGSPYLGADAGGAVALTAGVCVAAAMSGGGWLTFPRVAWALLGGFAATIGFALLEVGRPLSQRGSLGRFLSYVGDGTSGRVLHRIGSDNVVNVATSPLTLLVIGSAGLLFFALLHPWGGLNRLFGLYPAIRAAMAGIGVSTVIAGVLAGVGLNVTGAALATALPLITLASLRVLDHATVKTQPLPVPDTDVQWDTITAHRAG